MVQEHLPNCAIILQQEQEAPSQTESLKEPIAKMENVLCPFKPTRVHKVDDGDLGTRKNINLYIMYIYNYV